MSSSTFTDTRSTKQTRNIGAGDRLSGAVVVDKPLGWTSHDVVNKLRRLAGTRKIGHLGTLDPNATGVLPLLLGRATRLARFFGKAEKSYEGVIRFGHSTDSYDVQGTPTSDPVDFEVNREELESALERFRGAFQQVPPPVSAKKVGGVAAYKLARANQPVELTPVEVLVSLLEIASVEGCEVGIRMRCSAGTYVRSIAHEVGQMFGCGAYLKSLRRTEAGEFSLIQAKTIEELTVLSDEGRFEEAIVPSADLLNQWPSESVDALTAGFIRQGRDFRVSPFKCVGQPQYMKAIEPGGDLLAIGEIRLPHLYHPVLVLD